MKSVMSLFVATAFVMTCAAGIAQQPPASHIRVTEKTAKKMAQTAKTQSSTGQLLNVIENCTTTMRTRRTLKSPNGSSNLNGTRG